MARVTVEDCIDRVKNRFELVLATAQRSREISSGSDPLVERDDDKNPVIALREVANGKVLTEDLVEDIVQSMQHQVEVDEPEEDAFSNLLGDTDLPSNDLSSNLSESDAADSGMNIQGMPTDESSHQGPPISNKEEIKIEKIFNFDDVTVDEAEEIKNSD